MYLCVGVVTGRLRYCKGCKTERKFPEDFYKHKQCKSGYDTSSCRECKKRSASMMCKRKKATYDKKRRQEKLEQIRAYDKTRSKLPHRKAAHNESTRRRRAKLMEAIPEDYDRGAVLSMYKLAQKLSDITDVEMHVDHKVPLSKGGEHNVRNLQILAGSLNLAKGATDKCYFPKTHFEIPRGY